jgi:rod shape determining protein RodA
MSIYNDRNNDNWVRRFDWISLICWIFLSVVGLIAIYSATLGPVSEFLPAHILGNFQKQLIWVGVSVLSIFFIQFVSPRIFQQLSFLLYALGLFLIILTIFIGEEVNGAKSWIVIGGQRFQPAEPMKIFTILAVAAYLTSRRDITAVKLQSALIATGIILVPAAIIILQNDTGSALVFLPLIPVMLFLSGLPHGISVLMISPAVIGYASIVDWRLGVLAAIVAAFIVYVLEKKIWLSVSAVVFGSLLVLGVDLTLHEILQPHQQLRIQAFLNPFVDPQGAGWNVIQAQTAISSGGIFGKGFLQGTQTQLRFLPEQWTDFIFCVIAEEFGLIGAGAVIIVLSILFMRLLNLAIGLKDPFSQLVIVGVVSILFTHVLVNLGSSMGLIPVIGIPLPFLSYGGSSFLINSGMLAICLNLYLRQKDMSHFS